MKIEMTYCDSPYTHHLEATSSHLCPCPLLIEIQSHSPFHARSATKTGCHCHITERPSTGPVGTQTRYRRHHPARVFVPVLEMRHWMRMRKGERRAGSGSPCHQSRRCCWNWHCCFCMTLMMKKPTAQKVLSNTGYMTSILGWQIVSLQSL